MRSKDWWHDRWISFVDNAIFSLAVVLAGVVVALVAAVGTKDPSRLPLWLVVLFGLAQIGTLIATVFLHRKLARLHGASEPTGPAASSLERSPTPQNARLLAQVDAMREELSDRDEQQFMPWLIASAFNSILDEAKNVSDSPTIHQIDPLAREPNGDYSYSARIGEAAVLLAQVRAVLTHPDEE